MKRMFAICTMLILSLFAVGCEKTIELTDEENQLIAEYSAELLLKYDKQYSSKYEDAKQDADITESTTETVSATEETQTTTEEPSDATTATQQTTTEKPDDASTTEDTKPAESTTESQGSDIDDVSGTEITVDYSHNDFDLADFAGIDNVSITYQYSMITDTYPAYDSSGMYIGMDAPEGYKLLVLKFRIENLTNVSQNVDLYSKDITYKIIVDNKKSAKQMFTILLDDLYTYDSMVGESSISDAVLLFQVADSMADSSKDMKLQIEMGDKKAVIQLQ